MIDAAQSELELCAAPNTGVVSRRYAEQRGQEVGLDEIRLEIEGRREEALRLSELDGRSDPVDQPP
jgi:hypothetical protein